MLLFWAVITFEKVFIITVIVLIARMCCALLYLKQNFSI
jgi:cell division protein FtsL